MTYLLTFLAAFVMGGVVGIFAMALAAAELVNEAQREARLWRAIVNMGAECDRIAKEVVKG